MVHECTEGTSVCGHNRIGVILIDCHNMFIDFFYYLLFFLFNPIKKKGEIKKLKIILPLRQSGKKDTFLFKKN